MICNSFRPVFLNSLQEKALLPACALKDILRNVCCCVGYEGNSLKTSVILRTEHVKRKTVGWRMINYELPHSSNSVRFAFNNFPVQKIEWWRLAKKEITHVVTKRNSPVRTTANPLEGFMKIPFWRTVESPLYELLSKWLKMSAWKIPNFGKMEKATFQLQKGYSITLKHIWKL